MLARLKPFLALKGFTEREREKERERERERERDPLVFSVVL